MPRMRYPAPAGMKHCRRCDSAKPIADFAADKSKSDKLRTCCRACDRKRLRESYWTSAKLQARSRRRAEAELRALERKVGPRVVEQELRRTAADAAWSEVIDRWPWASASALKAHAKELRRRKPPKRPQTKKAVRKLAQRISGSASDGSGE